MVRSIWDEEEVSEEQKPEYQPEVDDKLELVFGDQPNREYDFTKQFEEEHARLGESFSMDLLGSEVEAEEGETEEEEVEEDSTGEDSTESEEDYFVDDRGGTDDNADEDFGSDWESFKAEFSSGENDDGWVGKLLTGGNWSESRCGRGG